MELLSAWLHIIECIFQVNLHRVDSTEVFHPEEKSIFMKTNTNTKTTTTLDKENADSQRNS